MKEYPIIFSGPMVCAILDGRKTVTRRLLTRAWDAACRAYRTDELRLWVREMFRESVDPGPQWIYAADYGDEGRHLEGMPRWRPSIHMSRLASRITLDVMSMRKERLQDISEEDATAEGVETDPEHLPAASYYLTRRRDFRILWNSLYRKPGTTWADNPEVYRIEFRVLEP